MRLKSAFSLATLSALALSASSALAAESLTDALKGGKFAGEIKAYYFTQEKKKNSEDILAAGVMMNYVTDSFYGFKAGGTFQSSATPFADEASKQMFKNDMWAQGAQLSESYLSYTYDQTTLKGGRMFISTPLVAGSGSRLIRESFEGYSITNQNIPDTTLGLLYINKFQARTDKEGHIGKFNKYQDGAYSLYAINKSIPGLTLTAAWARIEKEGSASDLDIFYGEAVYKGKIADFGYDLSGQYWKNRYNSGDESSSSPSLYGLKAGASYSDFSAYAAYSKVSDYEPTASGRNEQLVHGVGNGTDTIYTYSLIRSYSYYPNMEAWAFNLDYAFTPSLKAGFLYVDVDDDKTEVSYTGGYISYAFSGSLKGLTLSAQYDNEGKDGDGDSFRFRTIYKF
ncbi:OprD family outer membrane porin [Wolinella succinogenes]|uniref:OprD family outer membrane porin n=1 Tax=Wolinella succinogenes TaxID=844 RepID=UPI002FC6E462